jgi:hypothetical protein
METGEERILKHIEVYGHYCFHPDYWKDDQNALNKLLSEKFIKQCEDTSIGNYEYMYFLNS